jgi:hypothetical protein
MACSNESGTALGGLVDVGFGATEGYQHFRATPYVEQWSLGAQYQTGNNNLIDLEYIGNHALKLPIPGLNVDMATPASLTQNQANLYSQVKNPFYGVIQSSGCNLNQPTVQLAQLLTPYPQYCGVGEAQAEVASSWFNALQANFTHRWNGGLQILASFTWSKYLDNSAGVQGWTNGVATLIRNPYNLAEEKSYDPNDIPLSFVTNFVYDLPVGRGKHFGNNMGRIANAVAGGWQLSGIFTAKDGFPLSVMDYQTSGTIAAFGGNLWPDILCNPKPAHQTYTNWVNTACLAQPSGFSSYGDGPATLGYLRAPNFFNLDMALHKNWLYRERLRTEFRAEAFNVLNHTNFFAPGQGSLFWGPGASSATGFGVITESYPARDIQLALKLLW